MRVFIVIAAYNEGRRIGKVLAGVKKHYKDVVVVDDGSDDNTYSIANTSDVYALRHIINRGQGAALQTGIDFALSKSADYIVTFDADGQFLVEDIQKVLAPVISHDAEIALGSRFLGKAVDIPFLKKAVLKLGVAVVFFLYGIRVTDSQCGFRAFSRSAATKIRITSDRMEHAGEILHEIIRNKLKYQEVPITVIYDPYSLQKGQEWSRSIELGIKMLIKRLMR